jgi:hypothetical protein
LRNKTDNAKLLAGYSRNVKLTRLAVGPETPRERLALSRTECSYVLIGPRSIRPLDKIESVVIA